jgi:broad specificity phosphatase PhoE
VSGRLVLVKHSHVEVVPGVPAREWRLSAEGRRRATRLPERLRGFAARRILSSPEPKALATAEIVGAALELPVITIEGLHEHARASMLFLDEAGFRAKVATAFEERDAVVFGEESMDDAARRFAAALNSANAAGSGDEIAVAHGTVISLHAGRTGGVDPLALWLRLGLPSYVVLSAADGALLEVVDQV